VCDGIGVADEATERLEFTCPRCAMATADRFYGPCRPCRNQLCDLGGDPHPVVVEAYEPKMHVTPNNVAGSD